MKPLTFEDVTQEQVDALVTELSTKGHVQKQGKVYVIDAHSIQAQAMFENRTLTVSVLHKPIWLPLGAIESGIKKSLVGDKENDDE